jgi:pimeloyl-ACP methyl ester carboxylesterase
MPIVETIRGAIHFKDYGSRENSASALVLIHGAGGMVLDWPLALRKEMNAIALHLPGHGRSPGNGRRSIKDYAEDIVAFLDAQEIKSAVIAGHSMGGAIAQTLALDYSDYVKGLILSGTAAHLPVNQAIIDGLENNFEETTELLIKWQWAKDAPEHFRQQGLERLRQIPMEITRNDYLACNDFDVRERLLEISVPTLILAASRDTMIALPAAELLHEGITKSKLVVIENGGHMFPLEQPAKVVEVIKQWLEETF